jgi:MFS family permease
MEQNTLAGDPASAWHDRPDVRAAQRRAMRLLVITQIVGGVGVGAAASIGALLAQAVAHSETYAGLARTSSTLGAALFGLPLALLATRRGRRVSLGLGWLLAALGGGVLVVAAVAGNVVLLIVGMLLFGSGNATNLQSRYAAADLAAPMHRAGALSVVVWATTGGAVVGPNLAGPGARVAALFGLPNLCGGFLIAAGCLFAASLVLWTFLRPDPLLTARRYEHAEAEQDGPTETPGLKVVLAQILALPRARLAFVAVVLGNTVMGAVMTMTPVDMADHGTSLTIVGITISVHVLGMYAFAPLVGRLADRFGRVAVVLAGQAVFLLSTVLSGISHGSVALVMSGLFLLGLGWSFAIVAGSALLGESVAPGIRTYAQGTADTAMNMVAAVAAGVSGPVMATMGFGGLNVLAAVLVVPVVVLAAAARPTQTSSVSTASNMSMK